MVLNHGFVHVIENIFSSGDTVADRASLGSARVVESPQGRKGGHGYAR